MIKIIKENYRLMILALLIVGFIFIGKMEYKVEKETTDEYKMSDKFKGLNEDNLYDILTNNELNEFLKSGTGILFLASEHSEWGSAYATLLNDIATNLEVETIKFFDIYHAKETQNRQFSNLLLELEDYLTVTDLRTNSLFTPMVIFIVDGKIIAVDNETAIMNVNDSVKEYWNTDRTLAFSIKIRDYINKLEENQLSK